MQPAILIKQEMRGLWISLEIQRFFGFEDSFTCLGIE